MWRVSEEQIGSLEYRQVPMGGPILRRGVQQVRSSWRLQSSILPFVRQRSALAADHCRLADPLSRLGVPLRDGGVDIRSPIIRIRGGLATTNAIDYSREAGEQ